MPCGTSLQHTATSRHVSPLVIYHPRKTVLLKLLEMMFPQQRPRSRLVPRHRHVCSPVCQFVIILCIIGHPRMRRYLTYQFRTITDLVDIASRIRDGRWGEWGSNPTTGKIFLQNIQTDIRANPKRALFLWVKAAGAW